MRPWFATICYSGEIGAKRTLKKSCLPHRWRLLMGQIIQCLGHDALADSTSEVDPGLSAPNDSIPSQQGLIQTRVKNRKLKKMTLMLLPMDALEQQKAKAEAGVASPKARPSYPNINHLTDLLVTSLKSEFSKLLALHDFASCLPTALKELPSKFTILYGEIKELNKHVQDMEIEFQNWRHSLPQSLVFHPRFATIVENASAGQASASPAEGEKNTTIDAKTNLQNELVNLLGINMVEQYHNKKLLFDKYYDKMLKRRKS
uniref:Uncharacterized protein n=1 Tax=Tanacetum cinerariifolium TaxID=118510 RepID=A0A6L2MYB2_TANCI|nr:hypothetical protein [Tanacetum cinerariifolium]